MNYRVVGFVPDTHLPFEDRRAYALMLKVFEHIEKREGLHSLFLLGDYLDMYGLSFYEKDPTFGDLALLYDREIECGNARLDELDYLFPRTQKTYIEGNHEYRLKKYMKAYAGALRNRISVVSELGLEERKHWAWEPFSTLQSVRVLNSDLYARHQPYGSAKPFGQTRKVSSSFIYGHTHQVGQGMGIDQLCGKEIHAINAGCLIDFSSPVFDFVRDRPNWKHSFAVVWVGEDGSFLYQLILIGRDYRCLFDGKVFEA